jgi:hypothetical protein
MNLNETLLNTTATEEEVLTHSGMETSEILKTAHQVAKDLKGQVEFQRTKRNELVLSIANAESIVKEAMENDNIDTDLATELAEAFGWEMTKEVDVVITASIRATLTLPIGKSVSDVESGLSVDVSLDWTTENEGFEISVDYTDSIEIEEN